jgi:hypothetical protein
MSLFKRYYIFFLCVNIFLPKINLGFGSFYIFEFINLFLFAFVIIRGKILINAVTLSYVAFIVIGYISFLFGMLHFNLFDANSFARLIKFTFFIFYIIAPFLILDRLSEQDLRKVVHYQFLFFLAAGGYVIYHMITEPQTMTEYIWGYDNRYRLVGFTGYAIDLSGKMERLPGTTSVSMGVYVAFVFLIYLSIYHFYKGTSNLVKVLLLVLLEFLVYSRAGLLVMTVGLLYYFVLNARPSTIFKFSAAVLLVIGCIFYFDLVTQVTSAGSLSKVFNMNVENDPRARMLNAGIEYVRENPQALIIGTGYGEVYTYKTVGYTHLEGLLPTTLITSGIFAIVALCLHFFFIWLYARNEYIRSSNKFGVFLYGVRLFVPGWFLSALVAGNTFQTDYYFPVIYFIFVGAYYMSQRTTLKPSEFV